MDQTLIEHAENEVDDEERSGYQDRRARQRRSERLGVALEAGLERQRRMQFLLYGLNGAYGMTDSGARRQIERDCHRRKLALMVDHQRCDLHHRIDQRGQWYLLPAR